MAKAQQLSSKRLQINKASTVMVASLAITSFILVFSLIGGKALLSQRSYQAKVIAKKEAARDQLKANIDATGTLINSYKSFIGTSQNVIGGNPNGTASNDGDNAKIILDALPSQYDFPALATSLDKLLSDNSLKIGNISGTDDELTQQSNQSSATPTPVAIPFNVGVSGTYKSIQKLISVFEKSIRPIQISNLTFAGNDKSLTVNILAQTYYQPEKDLTITTEVVK
ncbi:MAG: type 4a pilus biogenesis protein PilO [Candidatus Saccharimonadales bacterium]